MGGGGVGSGSIGGGGDGSTGNALQPPVPLARMSSYSSMCETQWSQATPTAQNDDIASADGGGGDEGEGGMGGRSGNPGGGGGGWVDGKTLLAGVGAGAGSNRAGDIGSHGCPGNGDNAAVGQKTDAIHSMNELRHNTDRQNIPNTKDGFDSGNGRTKVSGNASRYALKKMGAPSRLATAGRECAASGRNPRVWGILI